ncbi:putative tail structure protein [Roseobacter phage CRP-603]|nr:putative tail structure protein [Roseobacter phage CRP-603]
MAYNFLGLVNEVNRRLNEVELTSSNFATASGFYNSAKDAVNASLRHINHEESNWPWNHVLEEETLTAGVTRYDYPTDAKLIDMNSFRIKKDASLSVGTTKLKLLDYQEYLDKYVDYEYNSGSDTQTIPRNIVRAPSQEFIVIPTPDKAYELVYEYYRNPVSLELWDDVPSVPLEFKHIIVDGAMFYAYQFRADTQASQIAQGKFETGIKYMRSLYINRYDYVRSTVLNRSTSSLRVS